MADLSGEGVEGLIQLSADIEHTGFQNCPEVDDSGIREGVVAVNAQEEAHL